MGIVGAILVAFVFIAICILLIECLQLFLFYLLIVILSLKEEIKDERNMGN